MIRAVQLLALLLMPGTAQAQTCSQANSDCTSKTLENVIVGAPSTSEGAAKTITNVVINTANLATAKTLVTIVIVPGAASTGVVPVSPMTHWR